MHRASTVRAIAALWLITAAGCVAPDQPTEPLSPDPPGKAEVEMKSRSANMLFVRDPAAGAEFDVFQTAEQLAELKTKCAWAREYASGKIYAWVNVWNRTGLAYYWHASTNLLDAPFNFSFKLPPDPPYLIWPNYTCAESQLTVRFAARDWELTSPSPLPRQPGYGPEILLARYGTMMETFRIPAGEVHAEFPVHLAYPAFFFMAGFSSANERHGQRYGQQHFYEPGATQWIARMTYNITDSTQTLHHGTVGIPGTHKMVIDLAGPVPMETVWTSGAGTWEFDQTVADLGFVVPFQTYDNDPL